MDADLEPDFMQTQAIFCDQLSDTEYSQVVVHLNVPIQGNIKEAKQFLLKEGPNVIGRSTTCDVPIISNDLSRKHAVIEIDKDSCLIYDTGSQNKTWKGKLLLKPNVKYSLEHNDCIKFGNIKSYITIEVSKEDEDAGSEAGSESLIPNNNDEDCPNLLPNCSEEPKSSNQYNVASNDKTEPVVSSTTIMKQNTQSRANRKLQTQSVRFQEANESYDDTTDDEQLVNQATVPYNECDDTDDEKLMNATTQCYDTQNIPKKEHNFSDSETDDEKLMNATTQRYATQSVAKEECNSSGSETDDEILMNAETQPNSLLVVQNEKCNHENLPKDKDASNGSENSQNDRVMDSATSSHEELKKSMSEATEEAKVSVPRQEDNYDNSMTAILHDSKLGNILTVISDGKKSETDTTFKANEVSAKLISSCTAGSDTESTDDECLMNAATQCYLQSVDRMPSKIGSHAICNLSSNIETHKSEPADVDLMAETVCYSESDKDEDLLNAATQPYSEIVTHIKMKKLQNNNEHESVSLTKSNKLLTLQTKPTICSEDSDSDEVLINAPTQRYSDGTTSLADESNDALNDGNDKEGNEGTKNILIAETVPFSEVEMKTNSSGSFAETQENNFITKEEGKEEAKIGECETLNVHSDKPSETEGCIKEQSQNMSENENAFTENDEKNLKGKVEQVSSLELLPNPISGEQNLSAAAGHVSLESDTSSSSCRSKLKLEESFADTSAIDILCAFTQQQDIEDVAEAKQTELCSRESDIACDFLAETQEDIINSYERKEIEKIAYGQCLNSPAASDCEWVADTPPDLLDSNSKSSTICSLQNLHSPLKKLEEQEKMLLDGSLPKSTVSGTEEDVSCISNNFKAEKEDSNLNSMESKENSLSVGNNKEVYTEVQQNTAKSKNKKLSIKRSKNDISCKPSGDHNESEIFGLSPAERNKSELELIKEDETQISVLSEMEGKETTKSEKSFSKSKRCLEDIDNTCEKKAKFARRTLFEIDDYSSSSEQGSNEFKKICNFIESSKRNVMEESNEEILPEEKEADSKNNKTSKRGGRSKENSNTDKNATLSMRTRRSQLSSKTKTDADKITLEETVVPAEVDADAIATTGVNKEIKSLPITRSRRTAAKQGITKSPTKKKGVSRNNNLYEENQSINMLQEENNNCETIIANHRKWGSNSLASNKKKDQVENNKNVTSDKLVPSQGCKKPGTVDTNADCMVKELIIESSESNVTVDDSSSDSGPQLQKSGHRKPSLLDIDANSTVTELIVESSESNITVDDNSSDCGQQSRKSGRKRKGKCHPEYEMYPTKRQKRLTDTHSTTLNDTEIGSDTHLCKNANDKKETKDEDLCLENNSNRTRSRMNKRGSKLGKETTGNTSGQLINDIAAKLLEEKSNKNSTERASCHNKESTNLGLSSETLVKNPPSTQERRLTRKGRRGKAESEEQIKLSQLSVHNLDSIKQSEGGRLIGNIPESISDENQSEETAVVASHQEENEMSSRAEERIELRRSKRSTVRAKTKLPVESPESTLLDGEENNSISEQECDISQNKRISKKRRLPARNIDSECKKPQNDSTCVYNNGGRRSRRKKSIVSKSKKSPIKKEPDTVHDDLSTCEQVKVELMTEELNDANIKTTKADKSDSSDILEETKLLSTEENSIFNPPKRANSRRKRKFFTVADDDASSVESSAKTLSSKNRRKSMAAQLQTSQISSPSKRKRVKLKILFTGLTDNEGEKIVTKLGGEIVDDPKICTHLVTDKFRRTVKMLCCIAQGIPVVEMKWLEESKLATLFVDHSTYLLKDKAAEEQYSFSLQETLDQAANAPLLQGWNIHATNNVKPSPDQVKDIVLSAGGKYLPRIPARFSDKTVIVSCPEDLKLCKHAAKSGIPIVGAEFLLTGLLRYENDIYSYQLSVT